MIGVVRSYSLRPTNVDSIPKLRQTVFNYSQIRDVHLWRVSLVLTTTVGAKWNRQVALGNAIVFDDRRADDWQSPSRASLAPIYDTDRSV
jgi:hypothetical protein